MQLSCLLFVNPEEELKIKRSKRNLGSSSQTVPKRYALFYPEVLNPAEGTYLNEFFAKNGFHVIRDSQVVPSENEELQAVEIFLTVEPTLTHFCCAACNLDLVEWLLPLSEHKPKTNCHVPHYQFHINDISLNLIEKLLQATPDMLFRDSENGTLLHFAAESCHYALFEMLLKYGADISRVKKDGTTVLHSAIERNHQHNSYFVQVLLERGAEVSAQTVGRYTPLHLAVRAKSIDVVRALLEKGAETNIKTVMNGETPLHFAMQNDGDSAEPIVRYLLQFGADVSTRDDKGATAMCYCHRDPKILQHLVEKGASVDETSNAGKTSLLVAVQNDWFESAGYILSVQPKPDLSGNRQAFHAALSYNGEKYVELARKMLEHGFNVKVEDARTFDLLCGAMEKGLTVIVQKCLDHGYPVNCYASIFGKSLLLVALKHDKEDFARLLLERGATVTPGLVRDAEPKAIKFLLTEKALDRTKRQYLDAAVKNGKLEIIESLLEEGFDPNAVDGEGNTCLPAITHSSSTYDAKVINLLSKFGAQFRYTGLLSFFDAILVSPYYLHHLPAHMSDADRKSILGFKYTDPRGWRQGAVPFLSSDIAQHLVKMTVINPEIKAQDFMTQDLYLELTLGRFMKDCRKEAKNINGKIGNSEVTYRDILVHDVYKIAGYVRNQTIVEAMKPEMLKRRFSIYSSNLICRFQLGVQQKNLMDQAALVLRFLFSRFKDPMPHDIIEMIVHYLSNRDLIILQKYLPAKKASNSVPK